MTFNTTYVDVIEDTVEHYMNNPRGLDTFGVCVYSGENGCMCAVGRVLDPSHPDYEEIIEQSQDIHYLLTLHGMTILLPAYHHLDNYIFWTKLQIFHDDNCNWVERDYGHKHVLSELGIKRYNDLLKDWSEQ